MNNWQQCPRCGQKNILYQLRTNTYLCRRCGKIWKAMEYTQRERRFNQQAKDNKIVKEGG